MNKVRAIEASLSCFHWGLATLVPFLGLAVAVVAITRAVQAHRAAGTEWNPAARYLHWGCFFTVIGLALSAICWAALLLSAVLNLIT